MDQPKKLKEGVSSKPKMLIDILARIKKNVWRAHLLRVGSLSIVHQNNKFLLKKGIPGWGVIENIASRK